ncbi:MAG TPA: EamA family transporter [Candidatus Dormibacteraeota bacterium]
MTRRGLVLFAAMCVIWGIPYLLIKVAVEDLSPVTLVFLRTGIAAALLLPVAVARGHLRPLLPYWRWVVVFTAVEVTAPWLLLSDAEVRLSSSLAGLLIATTPLIGALMVLVVGGDDRLDARRLAGMLIGLGGVAMVLGLNVSGGDVGAVAEVGLVAVGYAAGPLIIARRLSDLPVVGVLTAALLLTALFYAPAAAMRLPPSLPSAQVIASVAGLAVVCTAVGFLVFFALIAEIGPVRATVITYVNPAVAVILGVLVLHEPFGVSIAAGFALILLGSFLATRRSVTSAPVASAAQRRSPVLMTADDGAPAVRR